MSKKFALLVGLNYKGSSCPLNGCWNDVYGMKDFLITKGYLLENITIMTDEPKNKATHLFPTAANFFTSLRKFISLAKAGDVLFFHYSGHGSNIRDLNGDEKDGKDECICCFDPQKGGGGIELIVDDDLRKEIINVAEGAKLICLMDCCHSGTLFDLCYTYTPKGSVERDKASLVINKNVITISGCLDSQTSADAFIENRSQGALTYTFLKTFKAMRPGTNWKDFMIILDYELHIKRYTQIPILAICDPKKMTEAINI